MKRSLIIPVYRNAESIPDLLAAIRALAAESAPGEFEAVFVVDGSPDDSHARLRAQLPGAGFTAQLVALSRNFGSFDAIQAGFSIARGESIAVMAADLQEPPELVREMFRLLESGEYDVVVGRRSARRDPLGSRVFAATFWGLYRRFIDANIPPGGVDIFAGNRVFCRALAALEESHSSLIGLLFWVGFRRGEVAYERAPRRHGRSAWTFGRKLRYLSDSIFSFTDLPIRFLLVSGMLGLLVAMALGLAALVGRLSGWIQVPGYTATILTILFFGALMQLGLGIVGSYTWRAYENTKRRPRFIVMRQDSYP